MKCTRELKTIVTNMITLFINGQYRDLNRYTAACEIGLNRHDLAGVKQAFNNYLAKR